MTTKKTHMRLPRRVIHRASRTRQRTRQGYAKRAKETATLVRLNGEGAALILTPTAYARLSARCRRLSTLRPLPNNPPRPESDTPAPGTASDLPPSSRALAAPTYGREKTKRGINKGDRGRSTTKRRSIFFFFRIKRRQVVGATTSFSPLYMRHASRM